MTNDSTERSWANTARILLHLEEEGASATIRRFAREKLVEIAKELDTHIANPVTEAAPLPYVEDFITPTADIPAGYDTIIGWIAKNDPELLAAGMDDPRRTISDGNRVRALCTQNNMLWHRVPAPRAFRRDDIAEVNAYPSAMISRYFAEAV